MECVVVPVGSTLSAHRINHAMAHPVAAAPIAPVNFAVPQPFHFGAPTHYHGAPAPFNFGGPAPINFAAPGQYYPQYHQYNYPQFGFAPQQYAFSGIAGAPAAPQPMNDAALASAAPAPVNDAPQQQGPVSFSAQTFQMGPGSLNGPNFNSLLASPAPVNELQADVPPQQADVPQQQSAEGRPQAFGSPFFSHF